MAPSTLDLFILTFNCAKNFVNPPVFAAHLHGALSQNATGLPDVVVLYVLRTLGPEWRAVLHARRPSSLSYLSHMLTFSALP
jgi:hypothetical protein